MNVDLDFQRYVERRRGASEAQAREGAAYAFAGEQRVRRTLDKLRPVRMALEATVHTWQTVARAELLNNAIKTSQRELVRVHAATERAAATLHITMPTVYVATNPGQGGLAHAFGTNDDAYVVLGRALVDQLTDAELVHVVGQQCGRIQNGHVVFETALYYLEHFANRFVQWIVKPATLALRGWARRAVITADRAGLICTRDLDVSQAALLKLVLGPSDLVQQLNAEAFLKQLYEQKPDAAVPLTEPLASHPDLPRRVRAQQLFSESAYYRGAIGQEGGTDMAACDSAVTGVLGQ